MVFNLDFEDRNQIYKYDNGVMYVQQIYLAIQQPEIAKMLWILCLNESLILKDVLKIWECIRHKIGLKVLEIFLNIFLSLKVYWTNNQKLMDLLSTM